MTYAIVYRSNTGNTAILANEINDELGDEECVHVGNPCEETKDADMLYVGFYTDRGNCPDEIAQFLKQLHHKQIFLFGTAGFGGDQGYFERILDNIKKHIAEDNQVAGSFMCQGKMPMVVRERYVEMLPQNSRMQSMIENFDKALSHPDENDVQELRNKLRVLQNRNIKITSL